MWIGERWFTDTSCTTNTHLLPSSATVRCAGSSLLRFFIKLRKEVMKCREISDGQGIGAIPISGIESALKESGGDVRHVDFAARLEGWRGDGRRKSKTLQMWS
jgi:hypothetical protein